MNIIYLVQELGGVLKQGGLGEAALSMGSGMRKLAENGEDVDFRYLLPGTPLFQKHTSSTGLDIETNIDDLFLRPVLTENNVKGFLVIHPCFEGVAGTVYNNQNGLLSPNGPAMRAMVIAATLFLTSGQESTFAPDTVHLNDYHFSDVATLIKERDRARERQTLVLGNIHLLKEERFDTWDMKESQRAAIEDSSLLVAVSEGYAQELQSQKFGLDFAPEFARKSAAGRLFGILNGLDRDKWGKQNPWEKDRKILSSLGIDWRPNSPVVSYIHRIDPDQKGVTLFLDSIPAMIEAGAVVIINGEARDTYPGSAKAMQDIRDFAVRYPGKVAFRPRYDEKICKEILDASDLHCTSSTLEPCGYSNLQAMVRGVVPVVTPVGGLNDTVHEGVTGFKATEATSLSLQAALLRAIKLFQEDRTRFAAIARTSAGSVRDCETMAGQYFKLAQACAGDLPLPGWAARQLPLTPTRLRFLARMVHEAGLETAHGAT